MKARCGTTGFILIIVLAACFPFAASAVERNDFHLSTTRNLYDLCSVDAENEDFVPAIYACRGFIEGAVQYHDAVTDAKNLKRLICYTADATVEKGREAFVAWAEKHADDNELMRELPVVGLVRALADKYPCSE